MENRSIIRLILLVGLFMLIPGFSNSAPEKSELIQEIRFFSGSPAAGGVWYGLSVGITQIFEKSIPGLKTHLVPGGAGGSPISVDEGESNAGLSTLGIILDAQEGLPPFKKAYGNLRLLGNLYDHIFQIIVLKNSGINKISDLKGKVISPGIKGQYSEFRFKKLITLYNMDPEKDVKIVSLGFGDTVSSMKDGFVDCLASVAPFPMPAIIDLATSREIRFLDIDQVQLKKFCEMVNGLLPGVYPSSKISLKGKYNDIKTAFTPLNIIVRSDLPEDLVYKMTRALAENLKSLEEVSPLMKGFEPSNLGKKLSPKTRFHPGAEKYYRERGWK
jgi:TRAP transporter TAXI family solute receptor